MYLKSIELIGFKSFAKKIKLDFKSPITAIVGPNGSGKSNVAEAFRFVLGEQSIKSLRGKRGEDMIWNGSRTLARQNRASAKIIFDNSKRFLNIDFDEVAIERIVHRDNTNEYLVNSNQVRLKDIVELLAGAHIGTSGYHIISQGEADRILNSNSKERRTMVEDALGLKIYQYKRQESERKLLRTRENMEQVESLRREIAPHLKFLKKQVEKIEKTKELKDNLISLYRQYFRRENNYLESLKKKLDEGSEGPKKQIEKLGKELLRAKAALKAAEQSDFGKQVMDLESRLAAARADKDTLLREVGKLEGEIAGEQRRLGKMREQAAALGGQTVPLSDVRAFAGEVSSKIDEAQNESDISKIKSFFTAVKEIIGTFLKKFETSSGFLEKDAEEELEKLGREKEKLEERMLAAEKEEKILADEHLELKKKMDEDKDVGRQAEREIFKIMSLESDERAKLGHIKDQEERIKIELAEMDREIGEAKALVGAEAVDYRNEKIIDDSGQEVSPEDALAESRHFQQERRRNIERIKIKLEEVGGGAGEDIVKEFKDVEERDLFLERELGDLEKSAESLEHLIAELSDKLDYEFKEGVRRINVKFAEFFVTMFGGGGAELFLVKGRKKQISDEDSLESLAPESEEEEQSEDGIDIKVNLPHKKIKGLEMLSGGERALTSIALLFAISQVNPPPFIVLDETDAALDEANSKKYGNMIEDLSKYSQLVLITHNRETMSRAGVLYGVTMGQDGISKLLSIEFEEAVKVAK